MRREGLAAALGQHWLELRILEDQEGSESKHWNGQDTPKITACASSGVGTLGLLGTDHHTVLKFRYLHPNLPH